MWQILENINMMIALRTILDVGILWLVFYIILRLIRNNERTIQIFKGIIFLLIAKQVAQLIGLSSTEYLVNLFMNWGFIAIIVIFQPEIRNILEKLGTSSIFSKFTSLSLDVRTQLVNEILEACKAMSSEKTGALIAIEQVTPMNDYIRTGTELNAEVSDDLLRSIFQYGTPLHDGAVIIQGNRIAAAAVYFPPTSKELPNQYGARHRAALGMSEVSDCIVIVVSEETGHISVARRGELLALDNKGLKEYLTQEILQLDSLSKEDEKKQEKAADAIEELKNVKITNKDGKIVPLEIRQGKDVKEVGESNE